MFKASLLGRLGRHEEELATFEEVDRRFRGERELELREEVARALICRAEVLGQLRRTDEALAAFDAVVRRFAGAEEPPLRERVSNALNSAGFALLCEAKRQWPTSRTRAQALLEMARERITATLDRRPGEPLAMGNAGYIAFLQGRRDEARALLAEALRVGGERLRETELKDADIHPIPEDEEFRALVRSL
jgi:tetratricopeptide (TPR) repeat protein